MLRIKRTQRIKVLGLKKLAWRTKLAPRNPWDAFFLSLRVVHIAVINATRKVVADRELAISLKAYQGYLKISRT